MKKISHSADKKSVKKLILILTSVFSLTGVPHQAHATITGSVIQVARRLRMSYSEPLPPKDYFIDLGERDGLKVGDIVEAFRYVPVPNRMASGDWHVMRITLGELRIKQVGESTSVARFEKEREINALPAMDYQSLMLGDQVVVKTGLPFK